MVRYPVACLRVWTMYWRTKGYVPERTRLRECEDYTPAEIARWRLQRRARVSAGKAARAAPLAAVL